MTDNIINVKAFDLKAFFSSITNENIQRILTHIHANPGIAQSDCHPALGMHQPSFSKWVNKLVKMNLVSVTEIGIIKKYKVIQENLDKLNVEIEKTSIIDFSTLEAK